MIKKRIVLKKLSVLFFAITGSFGIGVSAQMHEAVVKNITVKGTVQFVSPTEKNTVILYKVLMDGKKKAVDSAVLSEQNKSFSFHLKQDHPGIYLIDAFHWDQANFWSDANVSVAMRGYDTARVHMKIPHYNFVYGSVDNNFINFAEQIGDLDYLRMIDEYNEDYYAKQYKKTDSAWATYLSTTKRYDSLQNDTKQRMNILMKAYKNRPVILYRLRSMTGTENTAEYDKALGMLDNLIKKYSWLSEAKEAKETIISNRKQAEKVANGQPLPEASFVDIKGVKHTLDKYKGHYLLIDFWASWCGPCRQAIPKVKELYNKYHSSNGFNVVSVSIDDSKSAWKKAMSEENMPWQQLLSPNKDSTMKEFQFSGIPTMYLVDPVGNIVNKFLGYGPDTEATIKATLSGKTSPAAKKKSIPAIGF